MNNRFILKNLQRYTLAYILLFIPSKVFASNIPHREFSEHPSWIRSLHYRNDLLNRQHRTKIPGFYLSLEADPYAELLANIKFAERNEIYQCLFPYRAKILEKAGLWRRRPITCEAHEAWKSVFSKERLYLAFASQYMSNPASVFGHTFLVFSPDREVESPYPKHLDMTVGYAADMPLGTGPFQYIFKGLGGGFKGRIFTDPLYKKFYEYSNMEQRDLWFYPIKISPDKIDDLLDHIYELTLHDYFNYFFIDENCSYMLLRILDVVFPEGRMVNDYKIFTLPVETIKALDSQGHLEKGSLVPSLRTQFLKEFEELSKNQRSQVREAINGRTNHLSSKESLDVLITLMEKRKIEKKGEIASREQKNYQDLLLRRSRLGPKENRKFTYKVLDPIKGHYPSALSLGSGNFNGDPYFELELRPAVHEILDLTQGYIPHSQIKLLTPAIRYDQFGRIRLQRLELMSAANLVPYKAIDPIYSWKFVLERNLIQDRFCLDCSTNHLGLGIGLTLPVVDRVDFFVLPGLQVDSSRHLSRGYRSGLGAFSGFILNFSEKIKFNPQLDYFYADEWTKARHKIMNSSLNASYNIGKSLSLRASYREWRTYPRKGVTKDLFGSLVYFF